VGSERGVEKMYKKVLLVCAVTVAAAYGAEFELKWDTGTLGFQLGYAKGLDTWCANDFEIAPYD
jgi:hypothetical protein